MEKLVVIDGNSIANRAFFGLPDLTTGKGVHTNAVLGFLNILFRIVEEEKPDYLTVAFDVHQPTFRHLAFDDYKAQRKPMDMNLVSQMPLLEDMLQKMNIKIMAIPGIEADDILGTLSVRASEKNIEAVLVSGDKDLLQLASDKVKIKVPTTVKGKTTVKDFREAEVVEEYGLKPFQIIELKALMGDSSDNYKGVEGIGKVGAVKLLQQYETVAGIYEHIDEIKGATHDKLVNGAEAAKFCKWLATIKCDADFEYDFESARMQDFYTKEAYDLVKELEMKSLYNRFSNLYQDSITIEDEVANIPKAWEHDNKNRKESEVAYEYVIGDSRRSSHSDSSCSGTYCSFVKEEIDSTTFVDKYFDELNKSEVKDITLVCNTELSFDGFSHVATVFSIQHEDKITLIYTGLEVAENYVFAKINELLKEGFNIFGIELKDVAEKIDEDSMNRVFDMGIAAYLVNPLSETYSAVDLARDYLNTNLPEVKEIFGKMSMNEAFATVDFLGENRQKAGDLLCKYTNAVSCSREPLMKALAQAGMEDLYRNIEMPLMFALRNMEVNGIICDRTALIEYGHSLYEKISALEKEIYRMTGCEFNINSPKQLGEVLFEKLKLPGGKKTKSGYSTAADVLEKLKLEDPVVGLVLEYRTYAKLKSTYAEGLPTYICDDGRIHTRFNQTVTATGRLSSDNPNLQNIPIRKEEGREIRRMFVPKEGCIFVDADYSQIELRLLAHMSGDRSLIDAYKEGQDVHQATAAKVFGIPFEEVTKQQRSAAKAVNFGIIYGMSSFGLGQEINVSRRDAENYINQYFENYPQIKRYLDNLVRYARDEGYSYTLFNRRRPIPNINTKNFMERQGAERIAMNSPIQGTAADIMKIALVNVYKRFKAEGIKSKLLLQVHDELLVETVVEEKDTVIRILEEEMRNAAELSVPLMVGIETGPNWEEAH